MFQWLFQPKDNDRNLLSSRRAQAEIDWAGRCSGLLKQLFEKRVGPPLLGMPTLHGMFMAQGDTAVTLNGCNSHSRVKITIS